MDGSGVWRPEAMCASWTGSDNRESIDPHVQLRGGPSTDCMPAYHVYYHNYAWRVEYWPVKRNSIGRPHVPMIPGAEGIVAFCL